MDEIQTKRLHVSGLTPAISAADLTTRLSSFGRVVSVSTLGTPDALGRPRPFGFVEIEGTGKDLARCVNVLSGSTWKGAKLRLGDAKPDYAERIAAENALPPPPPRKRKRHGARIAPDVDLDTPITPEEAAARPGWRVTPLGRVVRPIRMRPERPLPPPEPVRKIVKAKDGKDVVQKKRKRRAREVLRARRRTIDPTRWGSVQLKGMFLENASEALGTGREALGAQSEDGASISSGSGSESDGGYDDDEEKSDEEDAEILEILDAQVTSPPPSPPPVQHHPVEDIPTAAPASTIPARSVSPSNLVDDEKKQSLALLQSLFGETDDKWIGRETLSDVDVDEAARGDGGHGGGGGSDIEEVPMDVDNTERTLEDTGDAEDEAHPETVEEADAIDEEPRTTAAATDSQPPKQAQTKLKDLFAPRPEEAGFSLVGHLDLDFELELDDTDPIFSAPAPAPHVLAEVAPPPTHSHTYDPRMPRFFPPANQIHAQMRTAVASAGFFRTGSEADIRARWDAEKLELTRDWKKRAREAGKTRKRRGGAGEGE
ncbi:hypothetical protein PLICRDRAFT_58564 [Plicaturopsis crispa FD-325 SS-3]|uniref:RRM domain-containing protein n=1 Tax=Plicaturopsis crispa FD-325 SS-3 TaxID=944288 RepID=A0A0C9SVI3_PLICR|nr:hypothetical protein PLICRDRAFT_58564 [Plicaturopsis crispa FD-325 SS-3]